MAFLYYKNNNVYYLDNINNITPQNQLSYTLCDINYNPLITSSLPMACHGLFDRTNITDFNNSYSFSNNSDISWFFNQCHNLRSITINEKDFGQISRLDSFVNTTSITEFNFTNNSCNTSQFAHFINKCNNLSLVNFSQTDFKETNNFELMFYKCPKINNVKFDNITANNTESFSNIFDTESNGIKTISFIDADINKTRYFHNLIGVQTVILNGAKINEVTNITEMFKDCNDLTIIEAIGCQMNKLSTTNDFIINCPKITNINYSSAILGGEDLNLSNMFNSISSAININFNSTLLNNVSKISHMFNNCSNLSTITFNQAEINGKQLDLTQIAFNCEKLQSIDFSNAHFNQVIQISQLLNNCPMLNEINLINTLFQGDNLIINKMFDSLGAITSIDLSQTTFNTVERANYLVNNCQALTNLKIDMTSFSTATSLDNFIYNCPLINNIDFLSNVALNASSMVSFIYNNSTITNLSFNNSTFNNLTNFNGMINTCSALETVTFVNTTLPNLINMSDLFVDCPLINNIDLTNATMINLNNFQNLINVKTIKLDTAKLNNIDNFENSFSNLTNLSDISFKDITTKEILSTANMFKNCSSIVDIDLSSIVTNVTKCNSMFDSCSQIENINLNNFKIQENADITNMFNQCTKLKNVSIINCDDTTKEFIKQAIKDANLTSQVTIVES